MLDFQQKRKLRALAYSRVTLVVLGILVIFSLRSVWLVYQKQRESEVLRDQVSAEVAELTDRQNELNTDTVRLQTPQGVDAAAILSIKSRALEGKMARYFSEGGSLASLKFED